MNHSESPLDLPFPQNLNCSSPLGPNLTEEFRKFQADNNFKHSIVQSPKSAKSFDKSQSFKDRIRRAASPDDSPQKFLKYLKRSTHNKSK